MGRARDGDEVVGFLDLALRRAGGLEELALDLGQGGWIVAEELDELVAIISLRGVCFDHAAVSFSQTSRVALSCSMPIGLVMKPSMPAARLFCSCSSSALAVTARNGLAARRSGPSLSPNRRPPSE